MDQLKIESSHHENGFHIIRLNGPFTIQELFEFQDLYRGTTDLVTLIDLTNVPYMDSAALGAIVTVHMTSQRHQRHYALIGVSERLRSLFNVVGVDGLLVTCPTIEEAQKKFLSKSAAET
jgi:anti-sigma B factor antagonist